VKLHTGFPSQFYIKATKFQKQTTEGNTPYIVFINVLSKSSSNSGWP